MTARDQLQGVRRIQRQINIKLERIEELETIVNKVNTAYSNMPRGSHDPHRREATLAELIDMKNELMDMVDELIDEEKYIRYAIDEMTDETHKDIIEQVYINGKNLSDIADSMGITARQIYRLRDNAIAEMEMILNT